MKTIQVVIEFELQIDNETDPVEAAQDFLVEVVTDMDLNTRDDVALTISELHEDEELQ